MSLDWRSAGRRNQNAPQTPREKVGAIAFIPDSRPYIGPGAVGHNAMKAFNVAHIVQLMSFQFDT